MLFASHGARHVVIRCDLCKDRDYFCYLQTIIHKNLLCPATGKDIIALQCCSVAVHGEAIRVQEYVSIYLYI